MEILIRALARLLGPKPRRWADYQAALAAYRKGQYERALNGFRPLAETGHLDAQFRLGGMYRRGEAVATNLAQAANWYRRAAERGHGRAQGALGTMYAEGCGLPRDLVKAYMWFALSAQDRQGWEDADLAKTLISGAMTRQQIAEAERLVREFSPQAEY